ncbi:TolC family outer membrane protein [Oceanomicrobium pacificus]|uniref:TolC family outer membrane protein n=1 Tax=Oceanomicrobium pacificus TaxID=2692916 RepID=A0A6B0TRR7_9RHOB|nr:TolC family outer membrane protein [Oceanomicrobium pacificus]MXU66666.1 TolC family outer membrane protein [Oceanomicrobium pacificus]
MKAVASRLLAAALFCSAPGAYALSLEEAILYVIETNPQIQAAEANKQAIEFELDQARGLYLPRVTLEGRAGPNYNDGTTTPALTSSDSVLYGYEARATISQTIWDGNEINSEVDRQGYRIDAAALRVLERTEFLALEAARHYSDILRNRQLIGLAEENLDYHRRTLEQIRSGYESGVLGIGDLQQAEERLFLAEDTLTRFTLSLADSNILFLEVVGVEPSGLQSLPDLSAVIPTNLDAALAAARQFNPTLRFSKADVGAAEAVYRKTRSNLYPDVLLELEGRMGENLDGYEGLERKAKAELVIRYTFQGGIEKADRQEQLRRVSESRADMLSQARLVEREVRTTWARLQSERRRIPILERQSASSEELLVSYEKEFEVGTRSLLDILNTQNSLFQSKVNLVSARTVEQFGEYRLLAAIGRLVSTLNIQPPKDARPYAIQNTTAPPVNSVEDAHRSDPWTITSPMFGNSVGLQ